MKNYALKVKLILPFVIISNIASVIVFALIRWVFVIKFPIINVDEKIWELWIPLLFPWIIYFFFLRFRLRSLTFKKDEDNRRWLFQLINWFGLFIMLFCSQSYLTTATGKLAIVNTPEQISQKEKVRYYKIKQFYVPPGTGGGYEEYNISGKYNQNLNFHLYFAAPILVTPSGQNNNTLYWYGIDFRKTISNRLSESKKEGEYNLFVHESTMIADSYDFHAIDHFERLPDGDERDNYIKAASKITSKQYNDNLVILVPVKESYESRNGHKLPWIFGCLAIECTVLLLLLLWPGYRQDRKIKKTKADDLTNNLKLLIPKGDYFVTTIIAEINIIVFIIMICAGVSFMSPSPTELMQWGGNLRALTLSGEWWRLFTSMFVHAGIWHLVNNLYGLVLAAIFIEPVFGRAKYLLLYIISGLCGSLVSIAWHENTVSVGASGAIFGLYGAILALSLTNMYFKETKKILFILIGTFVAINLIIGLTGNIDNAAHIGGLLGGAVTGVLLYRLKPKQKA